MTKKSKTGSCPQASPASRLLEVLPAASDPDKWRDWTWQLQNAFSDPYEICDLLELPPPSADVEPVIDEFVVRVTPYYLNLICKGDREDIPGDSRDLAKTFLPSSRELQDKNLRQIDGMGEDDTHPNRAMSKLYQDRALLFVTNVCPIYCRYCFRKRKVGRKGVSNVNKREIESALEGIKENSTIRDVILSGGEPMMLGDDKLIEWTRRLAEIPHIGIIRIDTKFLSVCPFRFEQSIIEKLVEAAGDKVLHFTFHFTHPAEITGDVERVASRLADRGVLMNAYTPLLRDVNDTPEVLKSLFWKLATNRIRPYYLVQNVTHRWNSHFQVPLQRGLHISEKVKSEISGLASPEYVVYLPKGGGKITLNQDRRIGRTEEGWIFENHEGREILYYDPVEQTK